jgi:CPA1 family monovalent cation:H+ antiporter
VVFFGGALIGLVTGVAFLLLSRLFDDHLHQALVTLIASYTAYLLAHDVLAVSGIMAVLVIGLVMGRVIHNDFQDERGTFVDSFWDFCAFAVESVMFVLTGMILGLDMFEQRWLAILIGITALLVGRTAVVTGTAAMLSKSRHAIAPASQRILVGASLRGAVVLALALALPVELPYWWTIQAIAFGVVVFSLFVQAPVTLRALHARDTG